ncbi:hypothetical protein [Nonomuraea jiangxiensis]|uniref:hypothetical protein n=1 Tax=Nonomuraea jiangxiensis TaxID=633440 RepID=UPI001FEBC4BC|nr:hypothetical protein [Nonomuraea jiangxiensis]
MARRFAARIGVVREAAGIVAYRAGHFSEALSDLRAARRMTGSEAYLPVMADCERGLGRPERAIDLVRSPEAERLDRAGRIELTIVESGARRDLGQHDAAVITLQRLPELRDPQPKPWSARLAFAYADALADAGHQEAATDWFGRAMAFDEDGETDAAERYAELTGAVIEDVEEDFDLEDDAVSEVGELDEDADTEQDADAADDVTNATDAENLGDEEQPEQGGNPADADTDAHADVEAETEAVDDGEAEDDGDDDGEGDADAEADAELEDDTVVDAEADDHTRTQASADTSQAPDAAAVGFSEAPAGRQEAPGDQRKASAEHPEAVSINPAFIEPDFGWTSPRKPPRTSRRPTTEG